MRIGVPAKHVWTQRFQPSFAASVLLSALMVALLWPLMIRTSDAHYYRAIAEGHWAEVFSPFSKRVLHPLIARLLLLSGFSVDAAFRLVAVGGVIAFPALLLQLSRRLKLPAYAIGLFTAAPAIGKMFTDYYMPDLLHACFTSLYLLLLSSRFRLAAAMLLIPLFLVRESTILIAATVVLIAILRRDSRLAGVTALGAIAGMILTASFASLGGPNIHRLPDWLYYLLKVPNNLAWNVLGLRFWTNTQIAFNPCSPVWTIAIPKSLGIGAVSQVGYCFFDPAQPLRNFALFMTTFGVLPSLLLWRLQSFRLSTVTNLGMPATVALIYGAASLCTSLLGGNDVDRYLTYAWPLFFIALPSLVSTLPTVLAGIVLCANALVLTLPLVWWTLGLQPHAAVPYAIAVALPLHLALWITLRGQERRLPLS